MRKVFVVFSPFIIFLFGLQNLYAGTVNIPDDRHIGFSGIEYHVPRDTRMTLYQYKARKNQNLSEAGELESRSQPVLDQRFNQQQTETVNGKTFHTVDNHLVTDCGISIGNTAKPDLFAPKEQVVIIEGDVVNLGECE